MFKALESELQNVRLLNSNMLELTGQGRWDEFIDSMTSYVSLISEVMANDMANLTAEEQAALKEVIENLLQNEAVMMQHMRSRLDVLRDEMKNINKGKAISAAYLEPFTSFPR
ncbi:flagellar protein FliT [Dryocola sp. BD626]|uniref:flagellar protein FliT n=1 Tax=Dryocola sp. BD626 TaxID=3133273 RepID=UPI003F4FBA24